MIKKLIALGYERLTETSFVKVIKKINEYVDDNGNYIFSTILLIGLHIILDDSCKRITDGYAEPIQSFRIRTEQDATSFNRILNDFQKDLNELENCDQEIFEA